MRKSLQRPLTTLCKQLGLGLIALAPVVSHSQTTTNPMNHWSMGLMIGAHDGLSPSGASTRLYQIQHIGLNGRYMFNNRFGIMLGANYDLFDFMDRGYNTNYFRTSLEGVVNAGELLRFSEVMPRIGLLVHAGFGYSNLWMKETQTMPKLSDAMTNFVFGATPQIKMNEKWSFNADLSFIFHSHQDMKFDMRGKSQHQAIDGYFMNLSVGVTRYFGKNKSHADWTPTVYASNTDDLKARIATLEEQLKDDDGDGVPNGRDAEAGTPAGSLVDSKGVGLADKDKDGIADMYDACPDKAGPYATNGCPDTDKDGVPDNMDACPDKKGSAEMGGCPDTDGDRVPDHEDKCPTVPGTIANKGCPEVKEEAKRVFERALKGIQFETGKDIIKKTSFPVLDDVVKVMKNNPTYMLDINGHTDNQGDDQANMVLSQKRAEAVKAYLEKKGISGSRLSAHGFGETQPKASNDTPEGQAENRRVEFLVRFQ